MARLNEVPAPAPESLEAIKRRFIRQNREIARINSNQSIRIRNLETEISRLLAENIAVREEAISARAEAEKWRASHRLNKEIVRMKSQLEAKLGEVNVLVDELGALPDKVARRSSHKRRREGFVSELIKSAEDREPRSRPAILEQEGRLPAILEDKSYPRKTLEKEELRILHEDIAGDSLESPDLGPPPIAHFDESEPLVFNTVKSPRRTSTELIEESERSGNIVPANADSKRKRRTSSLLNTNSIEFSDTNTAEPENLPEIDTIVVQPEVKAEAKQPKPTQRAGAKRKLEMSELEDTSKSSQEPDDFVFLRKPSSKLGAMKSSRFSQFSGHPVNDNAEAGDLHSPQRTSQPSRKILAPKSTNSPIKRVMLANNDKGDFDCDKAKDQKPERRIVSRVRTRPSKLDTSVLLPAATTHVSEDVDDNREVHDPKTPGVALADILSPVSAEPSTKHKPKEMATTNSVEDILNGSIGRGSRRARPTVSYAPPKLNTKLRREGKELVGAVEGISKSMTNQSHPVAESFRRGGRVSDTGILTETTSQEDEVQYDRSVPASPSTRQSEAAARTVSQAPAVKEAINRLSIYDALDSSPAAQSQNKPIAATNPAAIPTTKSRLKRHSPVTDVRKEPLDGDMSKEHRRSASVSRLTGVPQRTAKRTITPESIDLSVVDNGGLRTRTSALAHRRSMLV